MLEASNQVVRATSGGTITSGSIKIQAYKRVGAGDRTLIGFKYAVFNPNGSQVYPTSGTETVGTNGATFTPDGKILPAAVSNGYVVVKMFSGTATTSAVLDTLTLTSVRNGEQGVKGEDGAPGTSPINVVLGNYSDVISCGEDDKILPTSSQTVINIPFTAYEGINRVACSVTAGDLHYNSTSTKATKNTQGATASSDGYIKYTIPAGGKLIDAIANQTVTLTFTVSKSDGTTATVVAYYTLGRSQTGDTGSSVYYGYIETPQGDVITNKENSVTLEAHLYYGATDRTSSGSTYYQWAKYGTNGYENVGNNTTNNKLTVNPSDVNGMASYRVKLMKYVSSKWTEQTYTPTATYTWSYLDKDGEETHPSGMATSGKIIYVDGDFVETKLTAFCKVEV